MPLLFGHECGPCPARAAPQASSATSTPCLRQCETDFPSETPPPLKKWRRRRLLMLPNGLTGTGPDIYPQQYLLRLVVFSCAVTVFTGSVISVIVLCSITVQFNVRLPLSVSFTLPLSADAIFSYLAHAGPK